MKNAIRIILQIFVWVWQLPQLVVCAVWCLTQRPRFLYSHHNVLLFTCRFGGGVSFGPMTFYSERHRAALLSRNARVMPYLSHEYGHALDSRLFGPLYLFVIGIPSGVWLLARRTLKSRCPVLENYYQFYTERRANRHGGVEAVRARSGYYYLVETDRAKLHNC